MALHRSSQFRLSRLVLGALLVCLMATAFIAVPLPTRAQCVPSCTAPGTYCFVPPSTSTQTPTCLCRWGNFEVGLGDLALGDPNRGAVSAGASICTFIDTLGGSQSSGFNVFARIIVNAMIALVIMAAAVGIVIGGYFYMTAGGNADSIRTAKLWIGSALFGILLALIAFTLLNVISPSLV